jgi:hypothetical protein
MEALFLSAKRTTVLMVAWGALAFVVWPHFWRGVDLWPLCLGLLVSGSSLLGMLLSSYLDLESCPLVDYVFLHRISRLRPKLYILAVSLTVSADFCASKIHMFLIDEGSFRNPFQGIPYSIILELIEGAIQEEIIFRVFLLSLMLYLFHNLSKILPFSKWSALSLSTTRFISANACQAFVYGALHVVQGASLISWGPWYLQVLASMQTWEGFLAGYIFYTFGTEAAIISHALADIALFVLP